ncbi:MAG: hypothetical protein JW720_05585 [Sedimentisphaerales bacterium]|nr:hypothetical protein [Sedimentisphaerales bacterium]
MDAITRIRWVIFLARMKGALRFLSWFIPCLWLLKIAYVYFPDCDQFWDFIERLAAAK